MDERRQAREGRSGQGSLEEHVQDLLHAEQEARDAEREEEEGPRPDRVAEERDRVEGRPPSAP